MYSIQDETVVLDVSRLTPAGYWAGNGKEQVVKGTALGDDCTTVIFTPSSSKMTGKYDYESQTWTEVVDKSKVPFWDEAGRECYLAEPSDEYPENAIFEAPPAYDQEKQVLTYKDGKWVTNEILLGKHYYTQFGVELIVTTMTFELPANHTFEKPPEAKDGYAVKLVDGQWQQIINYQGKTIYNTADCTDSKIVTALGEIETGWTLDEPATKYDEWTNGKWITNLQNQYEAQIVSVTSTREALYRSQVDRLRNEATSIRRIDGDEAKAELYEKQADAAYIKIRDANPFPTPPVV